MNFPKTILGLAAVLVLVACEPTLNPDFSYSPDQPTAGSVVKFTNLVAEGEEWNWDFGDGSTSAAKNPTKIFRKAGIYSVSLTIDGNNKNTIVKPITIYDTIPQIIANVAAVNYYESFTVSALAYNPYAYAATYQWQFSENAVGKNIENQQATSEKVTLFFKQHSVTEKVKLILTVGARVDTIETTFFVHDVPVRSLLMAQTDGTLLRQRIHENGLEAAQILTLPETWKVKKPCCLATTNNTLFVFDADTMGGAAIQMLDMLTNTLTTFVSTQNSGAHAGFFAGCLSGNYVYWTDFSDFVYRLPQNAQNQTFTWAGDVESQTASPYYFAMVNRLNYFGKGLDFGQQSGGFLVYDNAFFWGKQGTGRGIYRFAISDIQTSAAMETPPSAGVILSDFAIQIFDIDRITKKIYFVASAPNEKRGLWVCNVDGTNPTLLDATATGALAVDNQSDYLYYARATSVARIRLIHSENNNPTFAPEILIDNISIAALTTDNVLR